MEQMTPTVAVKPNYVLPQEDEATAMERLMWEGVRRGIEGVGHAVDKLAKFKRNAGLARVARMVWAAGDVIRSEISKQ